jgi:hypothetical protein
MSLGRARRGTSGALYPRSAIAGSNSGSRSCSSGLQRSSGVEGWVLRGGGL